MWQCLSLQFCLTNMFATTLADSCETTVAWLANAFRPIIRDGNAENFCVVPQFAVAACSTQNNTKRYVVDNILDWNRGGAALGAAARPSPQERVMACRRFVSFQTSIVNMPQGNQFNILASLAHRSLCSRAGYFATAYFRRLFDVLQWVTVDPGWRGGPYQCKTRPFRTPTLAE